MVTQLLAAWFSEKADAEKRLCSQMLESSEPASEVEGPTRCRYRCLWMEPFMGTNHGSAQQIKIRLLQARGKPYRIQYQELAGP